MSDSRARLTAVAPCLLVRDVRTAAEHWRDRFGFAFDRLWGDPPDFAIVHRDGQRAMLRQVPAGAAVVPNWRVADKMWDAYFWVDDARALYEELIARGAEIDYSLYESPAGVLEFGVQDADDHDIAFGQPLTPR